MKNSILLNYSAILNMEPMKLLEWLIEEFCCEIPEKIETIEDMENASHLLLKLSNNYAYLNTLCSYAKLATRTSKREKDKIEYENMVDRKDVIQHVTDSIKQQYVAISRAVTIHTENNRELYMNNSGAIGNRN